MQENGLRGEREILWISSHRRKSAKDWKEISPYVLGNTYWAKMGPNARAKQKVLREDNNYHWAR